MVPSRQIARPPSHSASPLTRQASGRARSSDSVQQRLVLRWRHVPLHIGTASRLLPAKRARSGAYSRTRASKRKPVPRRSPATPFFRSLCTLGPVARPTGWSEIFRRRRSATRVRIRVVRLVGARTTCLRIKFCAAVLAAWHVGSILRLLKSFRSIFFSGRVARGVTCCLVRCNR